MIINNTINNFKFTGSFDSNNYYIKSTIIEKRQKTMKSKNIIDGHILEIAIAAIVIVLSIVSTAYEVPKNIAWITGFFSFLVTISIIIIKKHVSKVANDLLTHFKNDISKYIPITKHLSELDGIALDHAEEYVNDALSRIEEICRGKIYLDQETYYQHLNDCLEQANENSRIIAINCIDTMRWSNDSNQIKYFNKNIEAADRGVKIHRVFLLNREDLTNSEKIENIIKHNNHQNITVDIILAEELSGYHSEIDDIVIFDYPSKRLYIDFPDNSKRTSVSHAHLLLNDDVIDTKIRTYNKLMGYALPKEELNNIFATNTKNGN